MFCNVITYYVKFFKNMLWQGLDTHFEFCICILLFFFSFFLFFFKPHFNGTWAITATVHALLMNNIRNIFDYSSVSSALMYCSRVLQTSIFSHLFIKNGSHSTIYTFKNYFTTVFSVFSFSKISYIQMDLIYLYFFKETYLLLLVS